MYPIMMRYIVCIMLGAFLMLGINSVLKKDKQEFWTKTGTKIEIQYHSEYYRPEFKEISQQPSKECRTVDNEGYCCKTNNGILGSFISLRTIPPFKTFRVNPTSAAIHILSSLNSLLSEKYWFRPSFYTNLFKYSNRYYIYALRRILI